MTVLDRSAVHEVSEALASPMLRGVSVCSWKQHVPETSAAFVHRRVPTGSVEIVWPVGRAPQVVGAHTRPDLVPLHPGTRMVGVRLRPEAAACCLGRPASELTDVALDAEELWGADARRLEDTLGQAGELAAPSVLEAFLVGRLAGHRPDPVMAEAVRRLRVSRHAHVAALARSLFVSERQFRRRCQAASGLTPKTLHAILRFHRFQALAWTHNNQTSHLGHLAQAAGFADQSHLNREAARWAGQTPRQLLTEAEHFGCGQEHDHGPSYGHALAGLESRSDTGRGAAGH